MKVIPNLLMAVATGGVLLAQPAAAATRSFQSLPQVGLKGAPAVRAEAPVERAENLHGSAALVFALLLGIVAAAALLRGGTDSTG